MAEMSASEYEAFCDAVRAGERAHVLTIGSPERTALRVAMGRLDRHGRFHGLQPDVFIIWRGCRRDLRELRERAREGLWTWLAWRLPRPLAYWATIRVGAHATTGEHGNQIVPELRFTEALERW